MRYAKEPVDLRPLHYINQLHQEAERFTLQVNSLLCGRAYLMLMQRMEARRLGVTQPFTHLCHTLNPEPRARLSLPVSRATMPNSISWYAFVHRHPPVA